MFLLGFEISISLKHSSCHHLLFFFPLTDLLRWPRVISHWEDFLQTKSYNKITESISIHQALQLFLGGKETS